MKRMSEVFKIGFKYAKKKPVMLFLWMVSIIATVVFAVITPKLEAEIIDMLDLSKDKSEFLIMIVLLGISLVAAHAGAKLNVTLSDIMQPIAATEYIKDVTSYLQRSSLIYLQQKEDSYFTKKINNACNAVLMFFYWIAGNLFSIVFAIVLALTMIILTDYRIAVLLLILLILNVVVFQLMSQPMYNCSMEAQERVAEAFAVSNEQFSAIKFIKNHGVYELFADRFLKSFYALFKVNNKKQRLEFFFQMSSAMVMVVARVGIYLFVGLEVLKGNMTLGVFTMLIQYVELLIGNVENVSKAGGEIQTYLASYDTMEEFLSVPVHMDGKKELDRINRIQFENLNFSYGDKTIFKDYNLCMKKGKIYGIKGENGAGKSTLLNLMLGLYMGDYSGKISMDGYDIKELNLTKCKQTVIGVTEQEPLLMRDTLYNNICLGNSYDREKIYEYGKQIGLEGYFNNLPEGLDAEINDKSTNISGGEKQKISILRQMLKNPDVMIFDEPTSALDAESVKLFIKYVKEIKKEKIILIVSHDETMEQLYDEKILL